MPHDRPPLCGRVLQPGGLAGGSVQGPYRVLSQSSLQQTVNAARGQVRGATTRRRGVVLVIWSQLAVCGDELVLGSILAELLMRGGD